MLLTFRKYHLIICAITCLVVPNPSFSIEISQDKIQKHFKLSSFNLTGSLNEGDTELVKKFVKALAKHDRFPESVTLNFSEGSFIEAIKLGKFFNETFMTIDVGQNCIGSCFIALVGGYEKNVFHYPVGLIPFQLPTSILSTASPKSAPAIYSKYRKELETYLLEMQVAQSLIDELFTLDNSKKINLSPKQFSDLVSTRSEPLKAWLTSRCDQRTQAQKEQHSNWRDFNSYKYKLFDAVETVKDDLGLVRIIKALRERYLESIKAYKASPEDFNGPLIRRALMEIRDCKESNILKEREKVLNL